MSELKNFFFEVIDYLCAGYDFNSFLFSPTYENYWNWYKSLNEEPEGITLASGLSKMVIIVDYGFGEKWVAKIPFSERQVDYCELEENNYKEAVAYCVQEAFAETFCIGGYPSDESKCKVYLMARADTDEDELYSHSHDYDSCSSNDSNDTNFINLEVINCLSDFFSCEFMDKLLEFCEDYSISDIHEYNIGFSDGRPLIIDYSGFFG
mgnify:CR=1 FL=1